MAYDRINWKDSPDSTTPLSAANLNKMDVAIASLDSTVSQVRGEANSARIYAESANTLATENQDRLDNLDTTIAQLEGQVDKRPIYTDYTQGLIAEWNTSVFSTPTVAHFYRIGNLIFGHLVFRPMSAINGVNTIGRLLLPPQHAHSFPCAATNTETGTITSDGALLKVDGTLELRLTSTTNSKNYLFDLSFFYCTDH